MKNFSTFFGFLCLCRGKRIVAVKIVQIALGVYLTASGTAIAKPSTVETPATPPRYERTEIFNGYLQSNKASAEEFVNVAWPRGGVGIERTKLCQDSVAEGNTSVSATSLKVITPKEMSANSSRQQNGSDDGEVLNDIIHQIIQGALFAILIAWPIMWLGDAGPSGGLKPNVKVRG